MKNLSIELATAVAVLATTMPGAMAQGRGPQVKVADAKPGDVRLIVSNGIRVPVEAVRADAEKAAGHPLIVEYGASRGLSATMESGQAFELAIVTPEVLEDMIKKGKVVVGSRYDVARVPVSIGLRGDVPKMDISTPAALKRALFGAKAIRYAYIGASRPTIDKLMADMGIAKDIEAKTITDGPGAPGPPRQVQLGPGEYELIINLASEVLPLKTQVYLGDIPKEFQIPAIMSAGIGATGDAKAAKALIDFLKGPAIEPSLKANGMTR